MGICRWSLAQVELSCLVLSACNISNGGGDDGDGDALISMRDALR